MKTTPEEEAAAKAAFERDLMRLRGTIAETAPEVAPAPAPPPPPLARTVFPEAVDDDFADLPTGISTEDRRFLDSIRDDFPDIGVPTISVHSSREAKDTWAQMLRDRAESQKARDIDPMTEAVWLAQQAVAKAREAGNDMETLFHAVRLYEEEAEMQNELVDRCAPRWAWEMIDEVLQNGTRNVWENEPAYALTAMITASERGDDVPISREEARRIREAS